MHSVLSANRGSHMPRISRHCERSSTIETKLTTCSVRSPRKMILEIFVVERIGSR